MKKNKPTKQELLNALNTEEQVKWTEKDENLRDVDHFILDIGLVWGKMKYDRLLLELLYEYWSKNPVSSKQFHAHLAKKIGTDKTGKYTINEYNLIWTREQIKKKIGPMLMKRVVREQKIKTKKKRSP